MSPQRLDRRMVGGAERGAVLIHVALAMTALCGFCAMAVDYGVLMAARSQAQAAADAGALAGATTLAFDDFEDIFGTAEEAAIAVASANLVAQGAPVVVNGWPDVYLDPCLQPGFPPLPPSRKRSPGAGL